MVSNVQSKVTPSVTMQEDWMVSNVTCLYETCSCGEHEVPIAVLGIKTGLGCWQRVLFMMVLWRKKGIQEGNLFLQMRST